MKTKAQLQTDARKLERQIADAEATLGSLRAKLAKITAQLAGGPVPQIGLDALWKEALPIARTRSSKQSCRVEWNRIPHHERPSIQTALDALIIWKRCEEWKKEGGAYVPGLHRWIKARQWENLPEVPDRSAAPSRYRSAPKPIAHTAPEDAATPEEIADLVASLKPLRMPS